MYKGHKISKRLERYMGYVETRYCKLCVQREVDLWDVLHEYDFITSEPPCVQMYIYDQIKGKGVYEKNYDVVAWMNGGVYVREVIGEVA